MSTSSGEPECRIAVPGVATTSSARAIMQVLVGFLTVCCAAPIWVAERFPSQNGPWFLLPTQMFLHYGDASRNYPEFFVRNWHPIPHMLHDALVGLASLLVPIYTAEKVILTVNALLLPVSIYALLSVVAPRNRILALLAFPMVLSYPFMRGYHDFTISIPLFFLTLAYWLQHRESLRWFDAAILAILSTLTWMSHLFTFALLAGTIGWISLFEARRFWRSAAATLIVTWPGWLLTADYMHLNSTASWVNHSDTEWLPLHTTIENFVRQYFHSVSTAGYVIAVATWGWVVVAIVWGWRRSGLSIRQVVKPVVTNPYSSLVLFLVAAYLVLPYKMIGWHKVNVRLVPFILGILLAAVGSIPWLSITGRRRGLLMASAAVCMAVVSGAMIPEIRKMEDLVNECLSGMHLMAPNSRVLAVRQENPAFGQIRPITRAHEHYHIAKGGANGSSIPALNTLSVMWYREYPTTELFPRLDSSDSHSIAAVREAYDYAMLFGSDTEAHEQLLCEAGFEVIHEQGRFTLLQNRSAGERRADEVPVNLQVQAGTSRGYRQP